MTVAKTICHAQVLSAQHQHHDIKLRRCPISGATLHPTNERLNLVYMLFQMNSGMGKNLQGGYRTAAQVRSCAAALNLL
jgi:hypothetical protein